MPDLYPEFRNDYPKTGTLEEKRAWYESHYGFYPGDSIKCISEYTPEFIDSPEEKGCEE